MHQTKTRRGRAPDLQRRGSALAAGEIAPQDAEP